MFLEKIQMNKFNIILDKITLAQVSVTLVSLAIASTGIFFQHSLQAYFWSLALVSIASILTLSALVAVAFALQKIVQSYTSRTMTRGQPGWFSKPKRIPA
jgi:hypothetical protein